MPRKLLKVLTCEVLSSYYPELEWLRIYADGSLLPDSPNAGVFSETFSFYAPMRQGSAFDGEIAAIRIALVQLKCHIDLFKKVVLCDSRAALLAIASLNNPLTRGILDCRLQLVLQWVPAHCGVTGNENADYLTKKGGLIIQTFAHIMPFCSIKQLINRTFKTCAHEELIDHTSAKSWRATILNLRNVPKRRVVSEFCLATDYDCLRKHLSRFGIVPSPVCTLFSSGEDMVSMYLLRCSALCRNSITERYWEARDMLRLILSCSIFCFCSELGSVRLLHSHV
ncbi:uncharacterized protein [Parasteatoda tepidariorum]|uniref:uncharacterized protein n=1 Tax=Parasteatoda tepidariorum TaxID=114398 RepID=UPI0039BCE4B4